MRIKVRVWSPKFRTKGGKEARGQTVVGSEVSEQLPRVSARILVNRSKVVM